MGADFVKGFPLQEARREFCACSFPYYLLPMDEALLDLGLCLDRRRERRKRRGCRYRLNRRWCLTWR